VLDLGQAFIRVYMYTGDRFEVLRTIDYGCQAVDRAIADELNVDIHIANAYRVANHNDILSCDACQRVYAAIAVEILKAINFYGFNNPDKELSHIHCSGGGSRIAPLLDTLRATLPIPLESSAPLLPGALAGQEAEKTAALAAAGVAMQGGEGK
jgi:type IV pilus assembly protein PilM